LLSTGTQGGLALARHGLLRWERYVPWAVPPSSGRPPNFVHVSEAKGGEVPHVSENESGPAKPDRQRFPHNKGSVAPALLALARLVLHAAVVAVIRKVLDQLIP